MHVTDAIGPAAFAMAAMSQTVPGTARAAALPISRTGAPDFSAVRAAGGLVHGVLPGGDASLTVAAGDRKLTIYAAQVTPGDGSPATFTKGVAIDGRQVDQGDRSDTAVANALTYVASLPNSLAEARLRGLGSDPSNAGGAVDIWV